MDIIVNNPEFGGIPPKEGFQAVGSQATVVNQTVGIQRTIAISDMMNAIDNIPKRLSDLNLDDVFGAQAGKNVMSSDKTPTVVVDTNDKDKKITFTFDYIKGAQGVQGKVGAQGVPGSGADLNMDIIKKELTNTFLRIDGHNYDNKLIGPQGANFQYYVNFKGRSGCKDDAGVGSGDDLDNGSSVNMDDYLNKKQTTGQEVQGQVYFVKGAFEGSMNSDIRFKTNIFPINDVLDGVKNLDIINYTWTKLNDPTITSFGVSAQQLEDLGSSFKQLVNERDDKDKTKWVDYKKLSVIALKAIQEQQKIIEDLEKRISDLENK